MSIISDVIVFHREIDDPDTSRHPAVERLLAWCRDNDDRGEYQVLEQLGIYDNLLLMRANFFPCEDLAEAFPTFGWNRPEQAVLITQTEHEVSRIVLGNGATMWWNSLGTGYQAPDYTEEEISEAELRIAALRQSAGLCIKCSPPVRSKVQPPEAEGSLLVPTPQQVLDTPMEPNDAGAATVREYLYKLLRDVWHHEQGFNGKRPFGNRGWQYEVYKALGRANYLRIAIDQEGDVEDVDDAAGDGLIQAAIASLLSVEATDPRQEGWAY